MSTHDCLNCPENTKKECPLKEIAPWLNEHEEEIKVAVEELKLNLSQSCSIVTESQPLPVLDKKAVVTGILGAFSLGYCKGRTYQDVPQVFKDV